MLRNSFNPPPARTRNTSIDRGGNAGQIHTTDINGEEEHRTQGEAGDIHSGHSESTQTRNPTLFVAATLSASGNARSFSNLSVKKR